MSQDELRNKIKIIKHLQELKEMAFCDLNLSEPPSKANITKTYLPKY